MSTNLPAIPNGPSSQDVDQMKRLLNVMNQSSNLPAEATTTAYYSGGQQRQNLNESYAAAPVGFAGPDDVNAMRSILERFHAAAGTESLYENEKNYEEVATNRREWLTEKAPRAIGHASEGYTVLIRLAETSSGKEKKSYDVSGADGRPVVSGLVIVEAATAVAKFLNKGLSLDSAKVTEVLDLEEEFNRNRIQAGTAKSRFERCVQLSENDAAGVFRTQFETARAKALVAQDQIKSILESIR